MPLVVKKGNINGFVTESSELLFRNCLERKSTVVSFLLRGFGII